MYAVAVLAASFVASVDFTKEELENMAGTWRAVSGEENGQKIAEDTLKKEIPVFLIQGKKITLRRRGKENESWEIDINPSKQPKTINLTFLTGPNKGKTIYGIYSIKAKEEIQLRIPASFGINAPEDRPANFSTGKGGLLLVITRVRI